MFAPVRGLSACQMTVLREKGMIFKLVPPRSGSPFRIAQGSASNGVWRNFRRCHLRFDMAMRLSQSLDMMGWNITRTLTDGAGMEKSTSCNLLMGVVETPLLMRPVIRCISELSADLSQTSWLNLQLPVNGTASVYLPTVTPTLSRLLQNFQGFTPSRLGGAHHMCMTCADYLPNVSDFSSMRFTGQVAERRHFRCAGAGLRTRGLPVGTVSLAMMARLAGARVTNHAITKAGGIRINRIRPQMRAGEGPPFSVSSLARDLPCDL